MRKTTTALLAGSAAALAVGCTAVAADQASHAAQQSPSATAPAPAASGYNVHLFNNEGAAAGTVTLKQGPNGLLMIVEATGLTPGWHGIHLHETGQCEAAFTSAGAHINHPEAKVPHGLMNADGPDDGDLPNIFAHADGTAKAEIFTTRARLSGDGQAQDLLDNDGSAIIIHASADDHSSQPIGGAGARVACGAIQLLH
ncbi:superoxide dismutase family protein [Brevundimonas terrae]|uniref:Superoxide dismutase [Cu-Zn] n=1 Tax=Brevundimonas terrae TaxID=363631 RepID=A0ABN0YDX1_9CAUL|nr:Cu-Zn family superoxide dismutase [Brevundimonas terrae]